jgi:hypothetical protein
MAAVMGVGSLKCSRAISEEFGDDTDRKAKCTNNVK